MNYFNVLKVCIMSLMVLLLLKNTVEKYTNDIDINYLIHQYSDMTRRREFIREIRTNNELKNKVKDVANKEFKRLENITITDIDDHVKFNVAKFFKNLN